MRSILLTALAAPALTLAGCGHDETVTEVPDPAAIASPVPVGPPVAPPPETPEAAEHATETDSQHAHGAPHGGTVKSAGSGHLEAVVSGPNLLIYVLDSNEATLPVEGISGARVLIRPENGPSQRLILEPMGDHVMATLPAEVRDYTAVVTVPIAGENRTAQFQIGPGGDRGRAR